MDIVLVEPRIAVNTGNIVRLCANVGADLHLVEPLGFTLDDKALRRGGLDYHELTETHVWPAWHACRAALGNDRRWFATSARSPATRYDMVEYSDNDVFVFGCEPDGLAATVLAEFDPAQRLTIPMQPGNRSINLAGAVSIVAYEAWRQRGFPGAGLGTIEEARPPIDDATATPT